MEKRFWNILAKRLCKEASNAELAELDLLVSENKHFADLVKGAEMNSSVFDVDASTIKVNSDSAWGNIQNKKVKVIPLNSSKSKLKWITGIAASVIVIMTSVWFFNTQEIIYQAKNNSKHIVLEDGSEVWLNANTTLAVSSNFNKKNRNVTLVGEAYFEVVKNTKPFIVEANNTKTKVLGTTFNIKALKDDSLVTTTLFTGKVQFSVANENVILSPSYYAAFNVNSNTILTDTLIRKNTIAWQKDGIIEFDETNFIDVVSTIESYYHHKIVVKNPAIFNCTFTGTFVETDLEGLIEVLAVSLNISYEIKKDKIIFTGVGCNGKK